MAKQDVAITKTIETMEQLTEDERLNIFCLISDVYTLSDENRDNVYKYAHGLSVIEIQDKRAHLLHD